MEIRANARKNQENDLSEIRLNSGNLIIILHKNSGKLSTAPPPPPPWKASAPYAYGFYSSMGKLCSLMG
jgi:hypothetical protein